MIRLTIQIFQIIQNTHVNDDRFWQTTFTILRLTKKLLYMNNFSLCLDISMFYD